MADERLTLHGAKDIKKHTPAVNAGTALPRAIRKVNPKRGGDTHQIKQWWSMNAKNSIYVTCSVFLVTRTGGNLKLAVPITESTRLTIAYDGADNFTFSGILDVDRIGVFDEAMTYIEEYRLPHIVGGKQMRVTPQQPTPPAPLTPIPPPPPRPPRKFKRAQNHEARHVIPPHEKRPNNNRKVNLPAKRHPG